MSQHIRIPILISLLLLLAVPHVPAQQQSRRIPILTKDTINKRDWTLHIEVRLHPYQYRALYPSNISPTSRFNLDSARFVYPILPDTGMSESHPGKLESKLQIGSSTLDDKPRIVDGYQGGLSLAVWEMGRVHANSIVLQMDVQMTSHETRIDEDRAMKIDWPAEEWDPVIASCLEPQLFIQPDHPVIQDLVREWTNGKPRRARPYYLAKYLAGKVVELYQPSEGLYESTGRGPVRRQVTAAFPSGFNVRGAVAAAQERKGSPLDIANLLCAVYRAAGIPSRLVIGFDADKSLETTFPVIRAWVEFYLLDEKAGVGEWIPVDILRQREFGSKPPPIDQRWQFFGHNEEFDFMCPFAFHWHPPTAVTNLGAPAIWGWIPQPGNPAADQELRFFAMETAKRAEDMPNR